MVLSFRAGGMGGGTMVVCIDGVKRGEIWDKSLCDAFVGVYVDSKSVSPALRKDMTSNIYNWFH